MGWVSFDEMMQQHGLTYGHLPGTPEGRLPGHTADHQEPVEQAALPPAPSAAGKRRGRPPKSDLKRCRVWHGHPKHQPNDRCSCSCPYCKPKEKLAS
jgi:hypothetical protein